MYFYLFTSAGVDSNTCPKSEGLGEGEEFTYGPFRISSLKRSRTLLDQVIISLVFICRMKTLTSNRIKMYTPRLDFFFSVVGRLSLHVFLAPQMQTKLLMVHQPDSPHAHFP